MGDIPLIDVSGLRSPAIDDRRRVAAELGKACREVGFFYATGHDVAPDTVAAVFDAAHQFFAQPLAAKETLSIKLSPNDVGYIAFEVERLDTTSPPDLKEAFNIGLELPPDHPDILDGVPFRGRNFWPALPGWRATMLRYYDQVWALGVLIHRGFGLDLAIPETFFDDKIDAPIGVLRLLRYPPQRATVAPGQLGAGVHTDYGNITILATDRVAGLQVRRRDGTWIDAPSIQGAFVCNIGDCLMRWTNDVYVSTPHRVIPPAEERFSVAFFLDPNPAARVETLPCFAGEAPKYPPTTGAAYLKERLDATYDHRTQVAP